LKGQRLYVRRGHLPVPDTDEFYHADLIGLAVERATGESIGTVRAIYDFGAGDVLEIADETGALTMVPFTREAIPEIDLAAGRIVVAGAHLDATEEG
jgi:16S rRNA processing protein RimM